MTLETLITKIKRGNKAAEQALFHQFRGRYLMACYRFIGNIKDAEECMLDGFFKFFITVHKFNYQSGEELHACIRKIMIDECLSHLRTIDFPIETCNN